VRHHQADRSRPGGAVFRRIGYLREIRVLGLEIPQQAKGPALGYEIPHTGKRGLRCPSEVLSLDWRHIEWEGNQITVPSPKIDRYDGKKSRTVPLFAELRPYLEGAFEVAEPGQTYVVGGGLREKA
jgi:hypothetical protein